MSIEIEVGFENASKVRPVVEEVPLEKEAKGFANPKVQRLAILGGVVLILHGRPMTGDAGWGWLASAVSLVSITLGTLYQSRYCREIDWRAGNLIQYIAVTIFFGSAAWLFETNVVHWSQEFVLSVLWLAVVLSIGSIGLLYWLIRRSAATSVASLFYLVPAVTALMAYVLFGEKLDALAIAGMVACAAAVFLVNRRVRT